MSSTNDSPIGSPFSTSLISRTAGNPVPAEMQVNGDELKVSGDEPLRRELAAFLHCVTARVQPPVDAQAGVRALGVVEAAARSSRLGRRVSLDEI